MLTTRQAPIFQKQFFFRIAHNGIFRTKVSSPEVFIQDVVIGTSVCSPAEC